MQLDPNTPKLKPPGTKRLKLKCDILLSSSGFKINLRRYNEAINRLIHAIEEREAFLTHEFARLYKGMNVNPLNEAVLSSAGAYTRPLLSST